MKTKLLLQRLVPFIIILLRVNLVKGLLSTSPQKTHIRSASSSSSSSFILKMAKKQSSTSDKHAVSVHWFRNGLRLHDNPCLLDASKSSETVLPLYIIDPEAPFAQTENRGAGAIRANFVLQSIQELNEKFEKNNQKLVVLLGKPEEVLPKVIETVDANALYYEKEPAAPIREMDRKVLENINCNEVEICGYETHTLHPMEKYLAHCKDGVAPSTYGVFTKVFNKLTVPVEVEDVDLESFPALPSGLETLTKDEFGDGSCPSLVSLGYEESVVTRQGECGIDLIGGEDAGIALLNRMMKRTSWVSTFEKPKTSPNALTVDTTGLSACKFLE